MARPRTNIPQIRFHKPSGQAVVVLSGEHLYLGPSGTTEAQRRYDQELTEWIQRGRTPRRPPDECQDFSVDQIIHRYIQHTKQRFEATGRSWKRELEAIKYAVRPFRALYGNDSAASMDLNRLRSVRRVMVDQKLSLKVVNKRMGYLQLILCWATGEALIPVTIASVAKALPKLLPGETAAPVHQHGGLEVIWLC